MVYAIEQYWITSGHKESKDTVIINCNNGPDNGSRRTQIIKLLVEFAAWYEVKGILAYYPPYHIERV